MRESALDEQAVAVADSESQEILAALDKVQGVAARTRFIRTLFAKLAKDEPQFAMELARALPEPGEQLAALKTVALELAFDDTRLATDLPSGMESAMLGATLALASTNPEAATLWAATQLEGRSRGMAIMASASRWAAMDPDAALAWATENQNTIGQAGEWIMNRVISSAATSDPVASANYLGSLGEGRSRRGAIDSVAGNWFDKNPQDAIAWMQTLPSVEDRDRAANSIASRWANSDVANALKWANTLPEESTRTAAASAAIRSWAGNDAPAAARYAQALPKGPGKISAIENVATAWTRSDASAATAWVQQLGDPELQKAAGDAIRRSRRGRAPR